MTSNKVNPFLRIERVGKAVSAVLLAAIWLGILGGVLVVFPLVRVLSGEWPWYQFFLPTGIVVGAIATIVGIAFVCVWFEGKWRDAKWAWERRQREAEQSEGGVE